MRLPVRLSALLAGAAGTGLLALGVVYLVVACENLPGILGPHAGEESPRTGLGILALVLGIAALSVAFIASRRHPPTGPTDT